MNQLLQKTKNKKFKRFPIISSILIFSLFFELFTSVKKIYASNNQPILDSEYLRRNDKNTFYILGPGDNFTLTFTQDLIEDEITKQNLLVDGFGKVSLTRLGEIYVNGLTINELEKLLEIEYQKFVFNPKINIRMLNYRPVDIYIDGEVENPGSHTISGSAQIGNLNSSYQNFSNSLEVGTDKSQIIFPRLIDALRKSGGLTINADISNIEIVRENSISNGGGKIKTQVNLLHVIDLKDASQNIRLFDGDMIKVNRGKQNTLAQISKTIKSNINPKFIEIYISGRVENAGTFKLSKMSTINDAFAVAGGTRVTKGSVNFIRYNTDGNMERVKLRFSPNAKPGSKNNPYLRNGDIIYVGKSKFNIATEILNEVVNPITGIVGSYLFFERAFD